MQEDLISHKTIILVNFSVVSGGAALLTASLLAGTGLFTPGALLFGKNVLDDQKH